MTLRTFLAKAALFIVLAPQGAMAQAEPTYTDSDWNDTFYAICGMPEPVTGIEAAKWVQGGADTKLLFTVHKGQVGACQTDDNRGRGSAHVERAEITQIGRMALGRLNVIEFEATFTEGFRGEKEDFFKIHNWSETCNSVSPLVMRMHRGKLQIEGLKGVKFNGTEITRKGKRRSIYNKSILVKSLYGKPTQFRIHFDTRGPGYAWTSVFINDDLLVDRAPVDFAPCALPYIKFGIYRPSSVNRTSQVAFDDVRITQQ
ncbi:hypothetical protein [Planktotalea sp.]|uniref:hypothetical protein n=1 Tax=Planktotalea sp. TaxID=2029877 RepID=UPI003297AA8A